MTKQQIIDLRNEGKTYAEIGEIFGVSRQRVHQAIGKDRIRKSNLLTEKIKYRGIYDFLESNPQMSVATFIRKSFGGSVCRNDYTRAINFFTGEVNDTHFTINQIKRLIEFTGKSFEELFEERV